MSDEPQGVEDLAARVADGAPVDWDDALRSAGSEEDRRIVEQLRLMEEVARVHGGGEPPAPPPDGGPEAPGILAAPADAAGPARWGRLELRERIGSGSFGELYRAWDPRLDRVVALKLLDAPPSDSGDPLADVVEEGRLLAKLRHPNVVTIHGADRSEGRVGLWMELIEGRSLEQILRDQGPMGAREAALIGIDLCRALAAVHGTGIVHRDVKAQNVMREQGGRIVLMDFGAGLEVGPGRADPGGKITGTPFYMAPELVRGEPATRSSDLYALGVLLYRLVTGRFPLEAGSWRELLERHARGETRLLRDARPDLPESFVAVVERATHPDAALRFATAGQMEQALAAAMALPSSGTSPAPASRRGGRGGLVIGAILAVAVIATFAVLAGIGRREAEVAREPAASSPESPSAPSAAADPKPAGAAPYTVAAAVYRVAPGSEARERLEPGARLALGDRLTLEIEATSPLHVYVVNEDEAGHAYALFPLPGLDAQNPLAAGVKHVLPGARDGKQVAWTVDSPGGREHLLVLASPARLVEYEAEMTALARPGQSAVALPEAARLRLRGLGSLSESPAPGASRSAGRLFEMAQQLAARSEVTSGVWLRRFELENPRP